MRAQSKARSATDSITPLPFFWTGHPRYRNLDGQRLAIEKAHRFVLQRKCNEIICVALALLMLSFQPCLRHHITQRTIQSETSSYPLPCTTTTLYSSLLPSTRPEYDTTCGNRPLAPSSCHYSSALDSRSPVGTTSTGQAACAKMDCEVEPISAPVKPPPPRVPTTTRSTAVENSVSNAAGFPSKA